MRMRISFWYAHVHFILVCACASHFGMRMRISFWYAHTHLILVCACVSQYGMRMRISFWYAHAHIIIICAYNFGMRLRISLWYAHAQLILACACGLNFSVRVGELTGLGLRNGFHKAHCTSPAKYLSTHPPRQFLERIVDHHASFRIYKANV